MHFEAIIVWHQAAASLQSRRRISGVDQLRSELFVINEKQHIEREITHGFAKGANTKILFESPSLYIFKCFQGL